MIEKLAYLLGEPSVTGDLRSCKADFQVVEKLPFVPCGEGEHLFINVRKTGINTIQVARHFAKYFSVKDNEVTYAGLKDRFAVTEQWFSVHLPGKQVYLLNDFKHEGITVLFSTRHNKKLRTGSLSANQFTIILRNVSDLNELSRRWHAVYALGVPNYFGEQRFGIDGGNIERAKGLFKGQKVRDKKKRGIYLSAARSYLFNQQVHHRLLDNCFEQPMLGDVMMLAGTQSVFSLDLLDDDIRRRFAEKDVDITASMWGAGALMTKDIPLIRELQLSKDFPEFCHGLVRFGLKQERRKIRLTMTDATIETDETESQATLCFTLGAGCFATAILRELISYQDLTERVTPT
jgi:tRNA pseudouridine13 synthase